MQSKTTVSPLEGYNVPITFSCKVILENCVSGAVDLTFS